MKRQREQAKREKKLLKAEKKAQRKSESDEPAGSGPPIDYTAAVNETEENPE
jgi:hypothetical protein